MINDLLLNKKTRLRAQSFISSPSHNLLIIGEEGAGKATLAKAIASQLLELGPNSPLENYPHWLHILPDGNSISIDEVRELKKFFRLRVTGGASLKRMALIENAHLMTTEAQTALLKLLEEPPADSVIMLTASNAQWLLPTIVSRTQQLEVLPVQEQDALEYLKDNKLGAKDIDAAYQLSEGLPALFLSLMDPASASQLRASVDTAKLVLTSQLIGRLKMVDSLARDKPQIEQLFSAMRRILKGGLRQALENNNPKLATRLSRNLHSVLLAQTALSKNASPKLLLTSLMVKL